MAATEPAVCIGLVPADTLSKATHSRSATSVSFRAASLSDAPAIWKLVNESGVLDSNSRYCYLLLCRDFADTCVVACRDSEIVGFVTAYRPPQNRDVVFVWQIGIAESARRQGLAKRLLHALKSQPSCKGVQYLQATVTPSNQASRRLFQSFAKDLRVACSIEPGFTSEMFGAGDHEEEELFCIGPFTESPKENHIT